jgi:hypothetical protein
MTPEAKTYDRASWELGGILDGLDPLTAADLAYNCLGYANRRAANGEVEADEWVEFQLRLAGVLVSGIAAWLKIPWSETLALLAARLEDEDFAAAVRDDIFYLPETDEPEADNAD